MRNQRGFTLIELMITVAIIALLSAIAIPQYQSYVLKAQTNRAYSELNSLRSSIEICQADGNVGEGCLLSNIKSDMLISDPVVTENPATITATFGTNAHESLQGGTIFLEQESSGAWRCTMTASISERLFPPACR